LLTVSMLCINHKRTMVFYLYDRVEHASQYHYDPLKDDVVHLGHPEHEFCWLCCKDHLPPLGRREFGTDVHLPPAARIRQVLQHVDLTSKDEGFLSELIRRMEVSLGSECSDEERRALLIFGRVSWHQRVMCPGDPFQEYLARPQDLSGVSAGQEVVLRCYDYRAGVDCFWLLQVEETGEDDLLVTHHLPCHFDRRGLRTPPFERLRDRLYLPDECFGPALLRQRRMELVRQGLRAESLLRLSNRCLGRIYRRLGTLSGARGVERMPLRRMRTLSADEMRSVEKRARAGQQDLTGARVGQSVFWCHQGAQGMRLLPATLLRAGGKTVLARLAVEPWQRVPTVETAHLFDLRGHALRRGARGHLLLSDLLCEGYAYRTELVASLVHLGDQVSLYEAADELLADLAAPFERLQEGVRPSKYEQRKEVQCG
jgi:hypothetical protein